MPSRLRRSAAPVAAALVALLTACDVPSAPTPVSPRVDGPSLAANSTIPAEGTDSTLDFGTWNVEWFGDASNGPSNEPLQQENVRDVIRMTDLDLWGLQEVVNKSAFDNLLAQLPGYTGFLANDPLVTNGAAYYSDFSNTEQKVGFIYKPSIATLQGARVILTANDYDFAGRPPLEATFSVTLNGTTETLVVIVFHGKAGATSTDRTRRLNASNALKAYLDTSHPTGKVMVLGDWNDDVDVSIVSGMSSPYANFVNDPADYVFPTKALSDAGISSTVNYSDFIDHHLNTNELNATYVAGSARAMRVDQYFTSYGTTTTDHYPVASRYSVNGIGGGGGGGGGGGTTSISLSAAGRKVRGAQYVDLTWSGATSTDVDVFRNSAKVTTTANDGAYTDSMGKAGAGTYSYKVCESGTTTCSNTVSVTF
ncbi:MAG TPA: endonuclease/exonuclease/phosphatase family protein [Gemmatimonadaceae bacterium]|nr:endonuclease/exonuclease/phosphatase family protein [Gemmatimonadaceae bacterium]